MFALQDHVDYLYETRPRPFEFRADSIRDFVAWQVALRQVMMALLRIVERPLPTNPSAILIYALDQRDYTEEKYALDVGEDVRTPIYLLIPKTKPPFKPILVFHGHDPSGAHFVLGHYPDVETEAAMLAVDKNYAQALARAGFLVCVVEQRGFGERVTDQVPEPEAYQNSCRHLSFEYLLHGRTMIGERCWDGMCALSFVQNRPDLIPGVMGCTGNSGGGTTTLWLSALDERITTAVPSCYFCSFKDSILGMYHCECNYVPGILQLCEMGDIGALIAPRPLRVIAGEQDDIFPVTAVRQQFKTVKRAYDLLNEPDHCSLTIHPEEHRYDQAFSLEWFQRWL